MAKDPEKMSFKELQEYELKVKKAKASVQERSRSELRQKLESIAANAGFKIGDLFAAAAARAGKSRPSTPIPTILQRLGPGAAASPAGSQPG